MFGGRDKNGEGNSDLLILKPETGGEWNLKIVTAKGRPPLPRIHHSMSYIKNTKYFTVFGGTNIIQGSYAGNKLMADFFLFDTFNSHWVNVPVSDSRITRSNMEVCENDDGGFFVFGGTADQNFVDGIIYKLTLQGDKHELAPIAFSH